jgi:predicted nucleic acid-binding protein
MRALFDTHILIDYLQGRAEAKHEIEQYEARYVSAVTVAELLAVASAEEATVLQAWLEGFDVVAVGAEIASAAAVLKQRYGLNLESALVWASAKAQGALFVTCAMHYPSQDIGIRKPY